MDDLLFLESKSDKGYLEKLKRYVKYPIQKLSFKQCVHILKRFAKDKKNKAKYSIPESWNKGFEDEHKVYLVDKVFEGPVFIYDLPISLTDFFSKLNSDSETT